MLCALLILFLSSRGLADGKPSLRLEASSALGVYRVVLEPRSGVPDVGAQHDWLLNVEATDGRKFLPTQLVIQGGMPGHGHGFPVEPQITRLLDEGQFLVEGMLFNMAGDWQLRVGIDGPSGWDTVTVELNIQPPGVAASSPRMSIHRL